MIPKAHASRLSSPVADFPITFRTFNSSTLIQPNTDSSLSGYRIINANRSITTWMNTLLNIQARNSTIPVALELFQMSQLMGELYFSTPFRLTLTHAHPSLVPQCQLCCWYAHRFHNHVHISIDCLKRSTVNSTSSMEHQRPLPFLLR